LKLNAAYLAYLLNTGFHLLTKLRLEEEGEEITSFQPHQAD